MEQAQSVEGQGTEAQEQASPVTHPEYEKGMAHLQQDLDRRAEKIRGEESLDTAERRMQMQELWYRAVEARAQFTEQYQQQLEEDSAERERSLFYVPPDMRDSVRHAYNDLYDRTTPGFLSGDPEGIEHAREEMHRLWERALRTGDRALQHAIGQLAIERGDEKLRAAYLGWSPEKAKAWERYVSARQKEEHFKDPQQRFWGSLTGAFSLTKPPEVD